MLNEKRITNPKKNFRGKCSLTGAVVRGSSCQNTRRGRGENTKKSAALLPAFAVLQYVFVFVNASLFKKTNIKVI
jgi:hypothetical protein